jgi:hypothetical protein
MKFKFITSLALCFTMIGSLAYALPTMRPQNVVNIYRDHGGKVIKYSLRVKKLTRANTNVKFSGRCDSACTLYLSMPAKNLCVKPGASFGFHRAHGATRNGNQTATNYLYKKYPYWVKSWIRSKGGLRTGIKRMDYTYASKYLASCNKNKTRKHREKIHARFRFDTFYR